MYKHILTLILSTAFVSIVKAQGLLPPRDMEAAYWYGIVVILGLLTMLGLLLALANLYSNRIWLHKLTLGFVGFNALMGIGSIIIYFSFSVVGWVVFLPVVTATTSGGLLWAKQKAV